MRRKCGAGITDSRRKGKSAKRKPNSFVAKWERILSTENQNPADQRFGRILGPRLVAYSASYDFRDHPGLWPFFPTMFAAFRRAASAARVARAASAAAAAALVLYGFDSRAQELAAPEV
jgi:hypothetical protein